MSLILDALRKMELERKAKRQSTPEIRAEVLNYRGKLQHPEKSWLLPVIAALLLISSTTAFFIYFKGSGSLRQEPVKAAVPQQGDDRVPSTAPRTDLLPLPAVKTGQPATATKPAEAAAAATIKDESSQPFADNNIVISGIAWQEERSLRRAVINGTLMGEGGEIFGATVVEIRENLVKFTRRGRTFEVVYSSGAGR
jgi:general secretion pathway protein B